jgi:hypothetical protein
MATHSKTDHAVKRKRRLTRRRREAELKKARLAAAGTPEKPNPRRWQGYAR